MKITIHEKYSGEFTSLMHELFDVTPTVSKVHATSPVQNIVYYDVQLTQPQIDALLGGLFLLLATAPDLVVTLSKLYMRSVCAVSKELGHNVVDDLIREVEKGGDPS